MRVEITSLRYLGFFIFGSMLGSFLNVCILRIPANQSVVTPPSYCPQCKRPIRWFDNIPCVSYFLLKGRCRDCHSVISAQYVMIETVTGGVAVLYAVFFGWTAQMVIYLLLSYAFLVGTVIDLRYRIIPDEITYPGIIAGLFLSVLFPSLHQRESWVGGLLQSVIGILVGGGFIYLTATVVEKIIKKEAMGGGDLKLLAMIGSFLGWKGALWSIFFSSLFGSVIGLYYKFRRGEETIAFGPHIAAAAVLYMFVGPRIFNWYIGSLGFAS
ncbi:MAG: prepilin peptidase [Candidatus Omnitrophota bacterium]